MSAKNPNRYGKNSWPVSTTVPKEIFDTMEALAAEGGIRVTAWARAALIQEARNATVYGLRPIEKQAIHAPVIYAPTQDTTPIAAEEPTNICELPDSGSSPAKTPIRYQPKKRKSSH